MDAPLTVWDRWYRRTLPAYWIFLFCATHFPKLSLEGPLPESDKLAHVVAFALLAFLFWRFGESFQRPVSPRFVWLAALWLSAYAAVDEYLQAFVGRYASWLDWLCDLAGLTLVLGVLEWRRRAHQRRTNSRSAQALDSSAPNT